MTHAIQRCKERYGVEITAADIRRMERDVAAGKGLLSASFPHGGFVYIVRMPGGVVAKVAVKGGWITTFLPPDCDTNRAKIGKHKGRKGPAAKPGSRSGRQKHRKYVRKQNLEISE